jgi:xylulokinase
MTAVIGIDVGTTGTKAAAYTPEGQELGAAHRPSALERGGGGHVEQDPLALAAGARRAIAACVADAGLAPADVTAIACGGQMAGVMGIDDQWRPVTPYDSWLDLRCAPQLARLDAEHGETITSVSGCPPMVDHAPKVLWWRENHPGVYARIDRWVMPAVYVAGTLTGAGAGDAWIDPSYLHFTGAADGRTGEWSDELLDILALEEARLPRIVDSSAVVGELTAAAAGETGLAPGTPVVAGAGDTACGALGAGLVEPGELLDVAGTAACLIGCVDEFHPDVDSRTLIVMRGAVAGQWLPLSYVGGAGLCLPWASRLLAGEDAPDDSTLSQSALAGVAQVPPGSEGLLFVPHMDGRTLPAAPELRGGWLGLEPRHDRPHLLRAVLESIAYEYAGFLRRMAELHPGLPWLQARIIGGGARSPAWIQIKSDVLGVPFRTMAAAECGTLGAALLAARGAGLIEDLAAAARTAGGPGAATHPDPGRHAAYRVDAERYRRAIDALVHLARTSSPDSREQALT